MEKVFQAGNTADSLRGNDRDAVVNTILLNDGESLTKEQIEAATTANGITDVISNGTPSAEDLDEIAKEIEIAAATAAALEADPELKAELKAEVEAENVKAKYDDANEESGYEVVGKGKLVTREEFNNLRTEFDVLMARVESFNTRSGHRI